MKAYICPGSPTRGGRVMWGSPSGPKESFPQTPPATVSATSSLVHPPSPSLMESHTSPGGQWRTTGRFAESTAKAGGELPPKNDIVSMVQSEDSITTSSVLIESIPQGPARTTTEVCSIANVVSMDHIFVGSPLCRAIRGLKPRNPQPIRIVVIRISIVEVVLDILALS